MRNLSTITKIQIGLLIFSLYFLLGIFAPKGIINSELELLNIIGSDLTCLVFLNIIGFVIIFLELKNKK